MKNKKEITSVFEFILPSRLQNPVIIFCLSIISRGIIWSLILFNPYIFKDNFDDKLKLFAFTFVPYAFLHSVIVLKDSKKYNKSDNMTKYQVFIVVILGLFYITMYFSIKNRIDFIIFFAAPCVFLLGMILSYLNSFIDDYFPHKK